MPSETQRQLGMGFIFDQFALFTGQVLLDESKTQAKIAALQSEKDALQKKIAELEAKVAEKPEAPPA